MLTHPLPLFLCLFVSFQGIRALQLTGPTSARNMSLIKSKINSKHLTAGDPLPPFNKLRLYTMRYCPFAQRAALTLILKDLDYETINIDTRDKPEWYATKSLLTKVPALEIKDGQSLYESLVIVEYLDDAYPQRPLLPKDPIKKALDKVLVEACTPLVHTLVVKIVSTVDPISDDVQAGYNQVLNMMQTRLQQQGSKFLDGAEPGYADYMIWPWFERLDALDDKRSKIDDTKYKRLLEYFADLSKDAAITAYSVPKEIFKSYYQCYILNKKPDYEQLRED